MSFVLSLAFLLTAAAQEEDEKPVTITAAAFSKYLDVRLALGTAKFRTQRTQDAKKREKIEAGRKKALADAGWSQEHYGKIHDTIDTIMGVFGNAEADPENKEAYEEELKPHDAATVAVLREKRKEYAEYRAGENKKIQERAREEELPPPVDPKELPGTWDLDVDETWDRISGGIGGEEAKKQYREGLAKSLTSATYVFGPDNAFESRTERPGAKVEVTKGTYRLDGRKFFILAKGSKKEIEMTAGMEDGVLLIGTGFMQTAFKKKKE